MDPDRKIAVIVGTLFIIATAAPIASFPFLQHLHAPAYLSAISANATQVTTGALLELTMALAIVGIAIMLHPVLKRFSETLALGYVAARLVEGVIFVVVGVVALLSLLTVGREFAEAGSPDISFFRTVGATLVAAHDWAYALGGRIVFSLSALILNYALFQSRLIPRFISGWGLIGSLLLLAGGLLDMFGVFSRSSTLQVVSFLPIALQEMVFAVWLIVKGFNPSAIVSLTTGIETDRR